MLNHNKDSLFSFIKKHYQIPLFILEELNPCLTKPLKIPGYVIKIVDNYEKFRNYIDENNLHSSENTIKKLNLYFHNHPMKRKNSFFIPKKQLQTISQENLYTYKQLKHDLNILQDTFPFMEKNIIGNSVLNKNLYELKIGNGDHKIHINASFHGNEWITTIVLIQYIKRYLSALCNTKDKNHEFYKNIFHNVTISFVPMVNPDGVDLVLLGADAAESYKNDVILQNYRKHPYDFKEWKANIKGIDLNKQFPAKWSYEAKRKPKKPNYRDFPGTEPLTEPEVKAMVELVKKDKFNRLIALHTQGEEIYWHYDKRIHVKNAEKHAELLAKASGYEAVKHLDNYAGFKDWFISTFQKEGYTIELGKGRNPLPISQLNTIQKECNAILDKALSLDF